MKYHVVIFIILFWGCRKDISVLPEFKGVIKVKTSMSPINSDDIGEVVDMFVMDSLLIVNEMFSEHIFKIFNVNNGRLINSFIKKGRGPNEMQFPKLISHYNNDLITTYDCNKKELIYFSFNDFRNEVYKFHKSKKIDMVSFTAYPINDSMLISTGIFKKGRYCLYNRNTNKKTYCLDYPYDTKHKEDDNTLKGLIFQGSIALKSDKTKFVSVCGNSGNIEICKLKNDTIISEWSKTFFFPEYKYINNRIGFSKNSRYAFHSLTSIGSYIYMIFSGRTRENCGSEYYAGNNLLVYDWNGNAIMNFQLDRFVKRMTIDKKSLCAYAYCTNSSTGVPEIIKFQLPDMEDICQK